MRPTAPAARRHPTRRAVALASLSLLGLAGAGAPAPSPKTMNPAPTPPPPITGPGQKAPGPFLRVVVPE